MFDSVAKCRRISRFASGLTKFRQNQQIVRCSKPMRAKLRQRQALEDPGHVQQDGEHELQQRAGSIQRNGILDVAQPQLDGCGIDRQGIVDRHRPQERAALRADSVRQRSISSSCNAYSRPTTRGRAHDVVCSRFRRADSVDQPIELVHVRVVVGAVIAQEACASWPHPVNSSIRAAQSVAILSPSPSTIHIAPSNPTGLGSLALMHEEAVQRLRPGFFGCARIDCEVSARARRSPASSTS